MHQTVILAFMLFTELWHSFGSLHCHQQNKAAEQGLILQVWTRQNLFTAGPPIIYTHYLHDASGSRSQRWLRLRPVLSAASVDVTPVGRDHRFLRLLPAPLQLGPDGGRRVVHSIVAAFVFWLWILLKSLVDAKVPHTHRTQAFICNHANNRHTWCLSELSVPGLETETAKWLSRPSLAEKVFAFFLLQLVLYIWEEVCKMLLW